MLIVLDSGPLGLLSNPTTTGPGQQAQDWARDRISAGDQIIVPEIADYEVRRELIRAGKTHGIARLDELCAGLGYHALSTPVMRDAAQLWAQARNDGYPTAHDAALDGDVLLAAQARNLHSMTPDERVVVATTNVSHLKRYVDASPWTELQAPPRAPSRRAAGVTVFVEDHDHIIQQIAASIGLLAGGGAGSGDEVDYATGDADNMLAALEWFATNNDPIASAEIASGPFASFASEHNIDGQR